MEAAAQLNAVIGGKHPVHRTGRRREGNPESACSRHRPASLWLAAAAHRRRQVHVRPEWKGGVLRMKQQRWSVPTGEPLPRVLAKQDGPEVREETEL